MIPCAFDEANCIYDKPESMTDEQCGPINAFLGISTTGPIIITCWKLTVEELEEVKRTGRIWCWHYGTALQPHVLEATSPFNRS